MKGFKTYLTFLNRNKLFTLVNVAGLSISLMFILLIANMVTRQLTVDKNMKNAERIYVISNERYAGGHYQLGDRLKSRFPEIEEWCSTGGLTNTMIDQGNDNMVALGTMTVRKNFLEFFNVKTLEGNAADALLGDNNIVLTRSGANFLFGTEHALGKTVKMQDVGDQPYTVTAIIEDIDNSIFSSDIKAFIPQENMKYLNNTADINDTRMGNAGSAVLFFRFTPHTDPNLKSKDVVDLLKDIFWIYRYGSIKEVEFIPIRDFYFSEKSSCVYGLEQYDFKQVVIFLTIGILILLMAVFNYVSMSIAQTSYRAKEMATRRLLGSSRPDIFWRMISESFLLTAVAFAIGFLLAKAAEPAAMDLLRTKLDLSGDLSVPTVLSYLLLIILLSLLSGFVPATILSNYNPLDVVKGTFRRKTKALYLRLLNIFQSGLTMAMLACSLYLSVQIYRVLHAPLGYEYGNILNYPPMGDKNTLQLFRNEVSKLPFVRQVAFSKGTPVDGGNNNTMYIPSADTIKEMSFQTFVVDSAFMDMYHIKVTENRNMSYAPTNYFISESAMKTLNEIGNNGNYTNDRYGNRMQIAGQFKDFKIRSLLNDEKHPLRIHIAPTDSIYPWLISVEVQDGDLPQYKEELDRIFAQTIDGYPFESHWYADRVKDVYSHIDRINRLIIIFTVGAFIISLLGLTAMSIYFIAQRKRDMAVRKVFGSNTRDEQLRLMKFSFGSLVCSLGVAIPLAVFGIYNINRIVPYDSTFPWWVPVVAFIITTIISLGSVYLISRKATRENPINNLKTE